MATAWIPIYKIGIVLQTSVFVVLLFLSVATAYILFTLLRKGISKLCK